MDERIVDYIVASPVRLVLVTVVGVEGSTPRHLGSCMLVGERGLAAGTIGGGMGEFWAIAAAKECLQGGQSAILELDYTGEDPLRKMMICGGTSRLLLELVGDTEPYALARSALAQGQAGGWLKQWAAAADFGPWPRQPVDGWTVGRLAFVGDLTAQWRGSDARPTAPLGDAATARGQFWDSLTRMPRLVILGAGHVGQALAQAAVALDFRLVVADDRPEYLHSQVFPAQTELISGPYTQTIAGLNLGMGDYVVGVSRGHLCDLECLRAMLPLSVSYFGLIGSDRKIKLLFDQARQDGFDQVSLDRVYAPIGLEIGSETPAEIAISILAQIIALRHQLKL